MTARCIHCMSLTIEELRLNAYYRHHKTLSELRTCAQLGRCKLCVLFWTALEKGCKENAIEECISRESTPGPAHDTTIILSAFLEDMLTVGDPASPDTAHNRGWNPVRGGSQIQISAGEISHSRVHASLRIFAEPDTLPAKYLVERNSSNQNNDPLCMPVIQRWLTHCQNSHPRCGGTKATQMPTRVIDLGDLEATTAPKLFVTNGCYGRYMALSYSWGDHVRHKVSLQKDQPPKEADTTFKQFLKSIPESQMTLAHRECLQIARALRYQYVWIDALCIIQKDVDDWNRESVKVASVYGNAELTLVAGRSADSRLGFLNIRRSDCPTAELLYSRPNTVIPPNSFCFVGLQTTKETGPVDKRAWCFQESVLSRRMVVYGTGQLSFKCRDRSDYEDGSCMLYNWGKNNRYDLSTDVLVHSNFTRAQILQRWYEMVILYSIRDVFDPTDNFAALAGIAGRFQKALECRYLAGLWENDMIRGLLWKSRRVLLGPDANKVMHEPVSVKKHNKGQNISRAPSWSWLALVGPVYPATGHTYDRKLQDPALFRCRPASDDGKSWSPDHWSWEKLHYNDQEKLRLEVFGSVHQVRCSSIETKDFRKPRWQQYSRAKLNEYAKLLEPADTSSPFYSSSGPMDRVVAMGLFDTDKGNPELFWAMCLCADEGLLLDKNSDGSFRRLGVFIVEQDAWPVSGADSLITLV